MPIAPKVGQQAIPFTILDASAVLPLSLGGGSADALKLVIDYLNGTKQPTGPTVQFYDARASEGVAAFTNLEVQAANQILAQIGRQGTSLHTAARFTHAEWAETQRQIASAKWPLAGITFASANPGTPGGKYDAISQFWYSFYDDRWQTDGNGVVLRQANGNRKPYMGAVQICKILHLMAPDAFPIFDEVLRKTYMPRQRATRNTVLTSRGGAGLPHPDESFAWEPFRSDLVANQAAGVFSALRVGLTASVGTVVKSATSRVPDTFVTAGKVHLAQWAAQQMTDLRLMDIMAWQLFA
jgi:hypothetical protein